MKIFEVTAEETNPSMNKVLTALKKKLKDEGGAAGFDPLKAVAKKMDVNLTPAMLKGMSGIKMHRDGDYILEESAEDQALQSVQKTLPKLQSAAAAGKTDKVLQYMSSAVTQLASMNMGDKLLNMFNVWATTIKKGIDDGVYTPEQLPQMQKAYDSIMSKMPELQQKNAKSKQMMAKRSSNNSKLDTKGNYKGTNITPTAQQLDRMEPANQGIKEQPGQSLPKQIDVQKMPPAPPAPTAQTPDGKDENHVQTSTTKKGNRSVAGGNGTYIFTPKGQLMLYMTPKLGGLQQTHNIAKQTVIVNFTMSTDGNSISQKGTYDMSGKLISGDNTSIASGNLSVGLDKDKGTSMSYKSATNGTISGNSKTGMDAMRNNRFPGMDKQT